MGLFYTIDNIGEELDGSDAAYRRWKSHVFLSSGSKYLQNSSRKQKISIIFAVVIGVWIDCNLFFGSYKDTK